MKNLKHITILMLCLTFSLISFAQVGIGTENPQATSALDITSTTQGFLIPRMTTAQREAITHSQNAKGLQVYDLNSKSIWISDGVAWIDTKNKFVDGSDPVNAIFVAGNVGVGTDSPSEKLDVTGNIRSNELILSGAFKPGSDSGTTGQILQSNGPDAAPVWTSLLQSLFTVFDPGTAGQILQSSGPGAVPVWTNASIIPAVKFVDGSNSADAVFVGGNVGVGTDSPSEKLDVTGNIRSNELILSGAFKPGSDSGTTGQILQSSGPDAAPVWTNASSTGGGKFVDGSVSTDAVFVGGNVGIGTDSPTSKLSVTGTISSTSDMVAGGNFSTGNALRFFTNPQTEAAYIGYTNGSNLYYRTQVEGIIISLEVIWYSRKI